MRHLSPSQYELVKGDGVIEYGMVCRAGSRVRPKVGTGHRRKVSPLLAILYPACGSLALDSQFRRNAGVVTLVDPEDICVDSL
jgi:hypothetical protein